MKHLRLSLISLFLAVFGITAVGEDFVVPTSYYTSLNGLKTVELKNAVFKLVRNFTQVSSYNDLPKYFMQTDVYPDSNRWWEMYSDKTFYTPSFKGLNREHSFPKSWWGGSTYVPCYVDLNHLYPSEIDANSAKLNYPLGEVDRTMTIDFDNGVSTVGYAVKGQGGGAKYVFEPADEYKGDFARTYFYMATAYQDQTWKYTYMVSQNTYPTLSAWAVEMLLKWHRQDPVSDKEKRRNEMVYKIQNNRNPFIDYPELAEYIWGNKKGQAFDISGQDTPVGDPELITPVQDMSLDFGQVAEGGSVTANLFFKGQYLTTSLRVQVYTGDKDYFTIPSTSIEATRVNSTDGYQLKITYKPAAQGKHTSRLLISGGGVPGSRGIALSGECLPIPTLTAPTATAATDITTTSYVANWTPVEGQEVDSYVVTRTKYVGGTSSVEEITVGDECSLLIDDFGLYDKEAYSVQAVRLGYRSQASNVIFVDHNGVSGVSVDAPLTVVPAEGGLRLQCSSTHTSVTVHDIGGRVITILPTAGDNTIINLIPGVYFITTNECHTPIKAIVK